MKVEKDGLKLLDDLEKLNGLPVEKKGTEIRKRLNIDENLLQKIENISGPYILIEGDRDKAMTMAAYIYLEKSTVYSDVYLLRRHEMGGMPIENPFKGVKKSLKVYAGLFHYKSKKEVRLPLSIRTNKPPMVTYKYLNQNGFMESLGTSGTGHRLVGMVFIDYYKGIEDKPFTDKGKLIREIIYENNFGYVDWITHPDTLNTLEIMDKGLNTATTGFDMLKFKNTVFLLDFMKGVKDKDCKELLEFSQKLHTLKTNSKRTYPGNLRFPSLEKPGFLIVHTDSVENWPAHFLELFYSINLYSIKEEIETDYVRKLLKYNKKEAKVEPKQIELFEFLYKRKDEVVMRTEICEKLWPGEEVSPIQIEQQVDKLRDALEKLGFKREIIETHKKTQLSEGAYEFHSDLSSFLK